MTRTGELELDKVVWRVQDGIALVERGWVESPRLSKKLSDE